MTQVMFIGMGLILAVLAAMYLWGGPHVRRSLPGTAGPEETPSPAGSAPLPRVAVIVPVTGNAAGTKKYLRSLLHSDYPAFEVLLVTQDTRDPAAALVREVLAGAPAGRGRHVVSGRAQSCGQKNHNLLAGVQLADPGAEVLVFCDATHYAPPAFLRNLVEPLAKGSAKLATGFHRIIPGDNALGTLGMLMTALSLHLMHSMPWIIQPWGGATAIRREVFDAYDVRRLWSRTVVDDMSLGVYLMHHGIRVKAAPTAILETPMAGWSVPGWATWLVRQLLYLKFCLPDGWLAASLMGFLLAGPLTYAGFAVIGGLAGLASWPAFVGSAAFLMALAALGLRYRSLAPYNIPASRWLAAFFALFYVVPYCYVKTLGADRISWRGIAYVVRWGGKVRSIIRSSR